MFKNFAALFFGHATASTPTLNALDLTVTNPTETPVTTVRTPNDNYPVPLDPQPDNQTEQIAHDAVAGFVDWLDENGVVGVVTVDTIESEYYEYAWATGAPLLERGLFFPTLSAHGIKRQKKQIDLQPDSWRYRIDKRAGKARPRRSIYLIPERERARIAMAA